MMPIRTADQPSLCGPPSPHHPSIEGGAPAFKGSVKAVQSCGSIIADTTCASWLAFHCKGCSASWVSDNEDQSAVKIANKFQLQLAEVRPGFQSTMRPHTHM